MAEDTLIPFMARIENNLSRRFERVVADSGHESEENYAYFERKVTFYECGSCEGCQYKKGCTRAKASRKIQISKRFIE